MQSPLWRTAKEFFQAALEQPPAEREDFIHRVCRDEALRREVLELIKMHSQSSDFLVTPLEPVAIALAAGQDPLIGRVLGGFQILRRIGMGGMGVVYEAVQDHPHRRAAVKVMGSGRWSPGALSRFEFESEILAKLHHPGIAQVYAAGSAEIDGRMQRWFAMELVEGPALPDMPEKSSLHLSQQIELLMALCEAVQHAHQRGVIHRDLKPDNIRLTRDETVSGSWRPKILDFGVARMIDPHAQALKHTVAGEIVGTLTYMSPEQLSGDSDRVDARSDVFALGVIGYEFLCGCLPHGGSTTGVADVVRAIETQEPTPAGSINPALSGDLEVILAKALEKDPHRRYQSASEFAADLQHYLRHEPVSARPATVAYQLTKFARRHRAVVAASAAAVLALIAGLGVSLYSARVSRQEAAKARYEAEKATAVSSFITNDFVMKLLAEANARADTSRLPVADLVKNAAKNVETIFAGEPSHEAAAHNEIGTIYYNLGGVDAAAEQFQRALQLWEKELGPDHPDTLKAVNNLGQSRHRQRRGEEAQALYQRAWDGRRRALGEDDPATLITAHNLAELHRAGGRLDEAEKLLRQTLAIQRQVRGPTHKDTIATLGNLATLLMQLDRKDEAIAMHKEAHTASIATLGADHVMTAQTGVRLGVALQKSQNAAEAEPLLVAAVASLDLSLGPAHVDAVAARRALARVYRDLARREQALEVLRQALDALRAQPGAAPELEKRILQDIEAIGH